MASWLGGLAVRLAGELHFAMISGPDSEEILEELVRRFAKRNAVRLHRCALQGDVAGIRGLVAEQGVAVDATLLPGITFDEVAKCNMLDLEAVSALVGGDCAEAYPQVEQHTTGDAGPPNELFPTGEIDEPETDLDTAFQSPLLRAAFAQQVEAVRTLLELGADPSFTSPSRLTAVLAAIQGSSPDDPDATIDILRAVATPGTINPSTEILEREEGDETKMRECALLLAVTEEGIDASVVRTLVELGALVPAELQGEGAESWLSPEVIAALRGEALE